MASTISECHQSSVIPSVPSSHSSISIAGDSNDTEKPPDENSKIRLFMGILKKFVGVADIATVRFSLPAQLLEPTPNLEYWNYLDQPNTFIAIGTSDDPLDRMLEVLRFWFTKDLKYVKGKPCKPYNSTLGEFFRCNWEEEDSFPMVSELRAAAGDSSESSGKSKHSRNSSKSSLWSSSRKKTDSISSMKKLTGEKVRVSYLTEQTSHHPPVSAFFVDCPERGLTACGYDQITAKFTGMSIKVSPGEHNFGFFINLQKRDNEEYHLTHPVACLGGFFRGNLTVTVAEQCTITCAKTRLKTILHYVEESWLGKPQNRVEGVIFKYDPMNDNITKTKDVPEKDILARISGAWREIIYFSIGPKSETQVPLIDLGPLNIGRKLLPPITQQLENESRRQWAPVTDAINARQFGLATKLKLELEEKQRLRVKEREDRGKQWSPNFFVDAMTPEGKPTLTAKGVEALSALQRGEWELSEN